MKQNFLQKIQYIREAAMTILFLFPALLTYGQNLPLEEGFKNPPESALPRTWWHWTNSNVTKEGITKDLEWMKRVGIGGMHLQGHRVLALDQAIRVVRPGVVAVALALADQRQRHTHHERQADAQHDPALVHCVSRKTRHLTAIDARRRVSFGIFRPSPLRHRRPWKTPLKPGKRPATS